MRAARSAICLITKFPSLLLITIYLFLQMLMLIGSAHAQSTNGTFTLVQETISAAGGRAAAANSFLADTALGACASGTASNGIMTLMDGRGHLDPPAPAPITGTFTVTGTINDPSATVTVNSSSATISGNTFSASGITLIAGPNTLTAVAKDAVGNTSTKSVRVYLDIPTQKKTPRFTIPVTGTINDMTASVSVNGTAATLANNTYRADVLLVNGVNTLTAVATDAVGNRSSSAIHIVVPLPLKLPPMPTVASDLPQVTTANLVTVSGTKTAGTSIWINGVQVVAADNTTTWSTTRSLVEGDNQLAIVAKDSMGTASAEAKRNVILDNLPPVITFAPGQPPAKTNFNPFPFIGEVDDSLSVVTVNNLTTARSGRSFTVSLPLTFGPNAVRVAATSPNGLVMAPKDYTIALGHVPTIQSVTPADGTKLYLNQPTRFSVSATDAEQDPIQYRLLVNTTAIVNWQSGNVISFAPQASQLGAQQLSIEVEDDFGGSNKRDIGAYVIHQPVQHP